MRKKQKGIRLAGTTENPKQTVTATQIPCGEHLEKSKLESLVFGMRRAYPFGPQSGLSSLLVYREHLLEEINSQKRCLERLQKDTAECLALAGSLCDTTLTGTSTPQFAVNTTIEQFLVPWLAQLEERYEAVIRDIQILATQSRAETPPVDESVFELLRAAG